MSLLEMRLLPHCETGWGAVKVEPGRCRVGKRTPWCPLTAKGDRPAVAVPTRDPQALSHRRGGTWLATCRSAPRLGGESAYLCGSPLPNQIVHRLR